MPGESGSSSGDMSGIAAALINAASTGITSAFNVHESRANRRGMRNMANTEMQRRVKDLRAAGLNPMLAVGGGGASTPHSAAAVADAPQIESDQLQLMLAARLNEAQVNDLNSAANLKNSQAGDITFMQKERLVNLQAQTLAALSQSGLSDAQRKQLQIQAELIGQQIKKLRIDTSTSALQLEKEKLMKKPYELINRQVEKVQKTDFGYRNKIKGFFKRFQEKKRDKLKARGGATGSY